MVLLCARILCATSMHRKSRRKKWPKQLVTRVFDKSGGRCHHCKMKISPQEFDVDHFPIRYADIEDQCCLGVTDPFDQKNLVASCANCNRSHRFERSVWCGQYSQCPLKRHWVVVPLRLGLLMVILGSTYIAVTLW